MSADDHDGAGNSDGHGDGNYVINIVIMVMVMTDDDDDDADVDVDDGNADDCTDDVNDYGNIEGGDSVTMIMVMISLLEIVI